MTNQSEAGLDDNPAPGRRQSQPALQDVTGATRSMMLAKCILQVDPSYQRDHASPERLQTITIAPDMRALGSLLVAHRRDDTYWIVDGRTRWTAMNARPEIKHLRCDVFESTGSAQEAEVFVLVNIHRTSVNARDKFRSKLTAGDATAVECQAILDSLDITVSSTICSNHLGAIDFAYRMTGEDPVRAQRVIAFVQRIGEGGPIYGELLKAMHYLDARIEDGIGNATFERRSVRLGAHKLMDAIKQARVAGSGARQMGLIVLGEVNRTLSPPKQVVILEAL